MIVATVSFRLHGGVNLSRTSKSLSQQDIQFRLEDVENNPIKDWGNKKFKHLPPSTRNHEVEAIEISCVQTLSIAKETYNAILSGESKPAFATCRQNDLLIKTKTGLQFNSRKWKTLSEYLRLWLFYSDIAHDLGAKEFVIHLL